MTWIHVAVLLSSACASGAGSVPPPSTSLSDPKPAEQPSVPADVEPAASASVEELRRDCTIENPGPCVQLCDSSDARGCYVAGLGFQKRPPETRDDVRSLALYQRGCELGSVECCGNLGLMFEKGRGAPPDPRQARVLYEKACSGGSPVHCRNVGRLCEGDAGFPPDAACAADAYARALRIALSQCSSGEAEGCAVAGFMYRDGKGVRADQSEAQTLLSKACDGGYRWACAADPHP
jgi:TPR repeat protein